MHMAQVLLLSLLLSDGPYLMRFTPRRWEEHKEVDCNFPEGCARHHLAVAPVPVILSS